MPPSAHTQYPAQYHNNTARRIEHHNQHVSSVIFSTKFLYNSCIFFTDNIIYVDETAI